MNEARRLYWILLHTSIKRLYGITFGVIILFLSIWLYYWYIPINRSIEQLIHLSTRGSNDINTNVNTQECEIKDNIQRLPLIAARADQAGIIMQRAHIQNNHAISFEGKGTITQIASFFELMQKENVPFQYAHLNICRTNKDSFVVRVEVVS